MRFLDDPIDVNIAARIRARRLLLQLSQEYVADALEISPQQMHKYETCQSRISASRLARLAEIFELPVKYFYEPVSSEQPALFDDLMRMLGTPNAVLALQTFCALPKDVQDDLIQLMTTLKAQSDNNQTDDTEKQSKIRKAGER